ncbi:MAG: 1-acyl-sn-glycerol-3-phosphate acyltransferase, partial [Bacteroidota bacterium]
MSENKAVLIDIDEVIKNKNPKLYKRLPGFILRYLKRLLHQDEMNFHLEKNKDNFGLDFVDGILNDFNLNVISSGEDNIPVEGRFLFAANHPLGALESMALMQVVGKHFKDIRFLVNDLLMHLKNIHPIFVPINKHGSQSKESLKKIEDSYASEMQVMSFPAGLVSRKVKGKIIDLEWKKNFISKAIKYKRDIIPVYINGRNSNFFYNFARFRKRIGIKTNIEMLFLPKE